MTMRSFLSVDRLDGPSVFGFASQSATGMLQPRAQDQECKMRPVIETQALVRRTFVVPLVTLALLGQSAAQTQTVERTVKGTANKDVQIGVYLNVQPDCSSGPLPTIRLVTQPQSGKVTVKK